ncbi:MAG: PD-(D/E)XK nuclease family protein, partial [Chthoniobacterales bacterium]
TLPAAVAVHSLIAAPSELSASFDEWGRPLAAEWRDRDPGWDDFDAQVHLCARGEDIAATLGAILPADAKPDPAFLEIGALDRELLPSLRAPIEAAGGNLHDPEGQSLDLHWLGRLLGDWSDFLDDPTFNFVGGLLRNGIVASWLARKTREFDLADALAESDKIRADFFPSTAESAVEKCNAGRSLRRALELLLKLRSRMTGRSWIEPLRAFLDEVSADTTDSASIEAAAAIAEALDGISPLAPRHPEIKPSDWLRLVRESLATQRHYNETEPEAVEASGWLELPWSDAPHLVLAGFNQGVVPSRFAQDPFLSAGIRQHLGLPTEEQRAARDAYFLARLLAMRRGGSGRVDVLVCQIDTDGAPGQPSPLLFAGSGEALPLRVQRLFAEPRPAQSDPPWEAAWQLDPPRVELKKKLRVTGFREYLACPFEFYLRFGLGMEAFDPEPAEMDARVFGTLVHETIKAFSQNPGTRDLADSAKIRDAVSRLLDEQVEARFEIPLSMPLLIQIESARQRLMAFADVQAVERSEGWLIVEAEISFFDHLGGRHWQIAGWDVTGQIDRIDHHEATGRWRVLDYKTSDKSEPPSRMHLRGGSAATHTWPPDYAFVESVSKWWSNLQLPLYRQFLIETGIEPGAVLCGYFNLPKAVSATGIVEWADFNDGLGESALRCACGVLADIEREKFWPPNPRVVHPQNADWFHPDPERTVAAESWLRTIPA